MLILIKADDKNSTFAASFKNAISYRKTLTTKLLWKTYGVF